MADEHPPTVEMSLAQLNDALGRATGDLSTARTTIERMRADLASRNTAVSRSVIVAAERVVDHLRETDEALRDVVKALEEDRS